MRFEQFGNTVPVTESQTWANLYQVGEAIAYLSRWHPGDISRRDLRRRIERTACTCSTDDRHLARL
jgi:hypothetical protein